MGNTSTPPGSGPLGGALAQVPKKFRSRIIKAYDEIKRRHRESAYSASFDSAGLSAGKFCECVVRLLQHELTGGSIPFGKHIANFADECQKLIRVPKAAGPETLRVIVPRALQFLYTMRGKRGIGHIGGDVEPNAIDLETMARTCDWIMCELIRVFHGLSLEDAQALVDSIATKQIPDIWEVAGKKRVLRRGLSYKQRVLLLLHSEADSAALSEDLVTWTEYPGMAKFRQRVLGPMHSEKLVEYDRQAEIVYLSPLGVIEVEKNLLDRVTNPS